MQERIHVQQNGKASVQHWAASRAIVLDVKGETRDGPGSLGINY